MLKRLIIFSVLLTTVLVVVGISFYNSENLKTKETDAGGFGISPPYFYNDELKPGDVYQSVIYALRSNNEGIEGVSVKITAPEIESWLSLYPGHELDFDDGDLQVPVLLKATVPADAKPGVYKGTINLYYHPGRSGIFKKGNQVMLGAKGDIRLTVVDPTANAKVVRDMAIATNTTEYIVRNNDLYQKWKGYFVYTEGEDKLMYYVSPAEKMIFDVSTTSLLALLLPKQSTGITNVNLDKIAIAPVFNSASDTDADGLPDFFEELIGTKPDIADTDGDKFGDFEEVEKSYDPLKRRKSKITDNVFSQKLAGRILMQVEDRGRLWYVYPADQKRYFLGADEYASQLVAKLALEISIAELSKMINTQ